MPPKILDYAKELRQQSTDAETLLWSKLRSRRMEGVKFRRQQPIENYIVDFVSFEKRLVIELDGGQHSSDKAKDRKRDKILRLNGYTVLRFWNNEVFGNLDGVPEVIRRHCTR